MLFQSIFDFIVQFITDLLNELPTLEVSIPQNIFNIVNTVFACVGYFLPMSYLMPVYILYFSMDFIRIIVALIVRVKSFIPTMGA